MAFNQWLKAFPLLLLAAAGCNKHTLPAASKISLPDDGGKVMEAQNHFAFELFKAALQDNPAASNKLVSPLSIYLDLSMAYNGAAGSTRSAMQQALQLHDIETNLLNQTNSSLIDGLPKADPGVTLRIANSIWYRNQGVQPLPAFLKVNSDYYQAQVTGAGFSPATVAEINRWVAGQTNQKIKTIIQQIDPTDFMYLINAVYFKGQWKNSFDSKKTRERPFHTRGSGTVQVPFMTKEARFNYMHNDTVQLAELPYGNGSFNMYVLLPSENTAPGALASALNENKLKQYIGSLDSVKINLWLPKWKYSYEISDLKPELSSMGMGIAFSREADFSGMYPANAGAYISKVVHKTYIEVNEQGTEAAAATSIAGSITSVSTTPPPVMDVNRPFLYIITEKHSGAILFIGEVNNPAEN